MSKRNLILLIIILILIIITVFGFLYFNSTKNTAENTTEGTNFFQQFNLFGLGKPPVTVVTPPVVITETPPVTTPATPKTMLNKISSMPIAGFTVFSKERFKEFPVVPSTPTPEGVGVPTSQKKSSGSVGTEFVSALRYVEKANGNIYQTFVDKIEERKFSTTVIPKIYEAFFGNNGESVVMRHLKENGRTIETFVGTLPKELLGGDTTETNEIKGSFLPDNIKDISISPDNSKIFYLFVNTNGTNESMIGATLNLATNKKTQIFDSPFTEWLSFWPNSNIINLTTKPSTTIPGYMYSMDASGKNLTKTLGDINGLTTLESPNGKLVLYGSNGFPSDLRPTLSIYHTDTRNSDLLGLNTLPEKCVWNKTGDFIYCAVPETIPVGEYPDTWYQGEVSFKDQFWKIDVKTGNTTLIFDPSKAVGGEDIDGIKLALDGDENYLFFVNKKDSFLWKLDLK